jgi:hypothetical protein
MYEVKYVRNGIVDSKNFESVDTFKEWLNVTMANVPTAIVEIKIK